MGPEAVVRNIWPYWPCSWHLFLCQILISNSSHTPQFLAKILWHQQVGDLCDQTKIRSTGGEGRTAHAEKAEEVEEGWVEGGRSGGGGGEERMKND